MRKGKEEKGKAARARERLPEKRKALFTPEKKEKSCVTE